MLFHTDVTEWRKKMRRVARFYTKYWSALVRGCIARRWDYMVPSQTGWAIWCVSNDGRLECRLSVLCRPCIIECEGIGSLLPVLTHPTHTATTAHGISLHLHYILYYTLHVDNSPSRERTSMIHASKGGAPSFDTWQYNQDVNKCSRALGNVIRALPVGQQQPAIIYYLGITGCILS